MEDVFNSANDPVFFLHHGGMDYIWALWQEHDLKRLNEFDYKTNGTAPKLLSDSEIWVGAFGSDVTAKQVSDPLNRDGNGVLCYKYEGLSFEKYKTR